MRVVVDTNTIISALFWGGIPGQVYIAALNDRYTLLSSSELLDELNDVLHRPKFMAALAAIGRNADDIVLEHQEIVEFVASAEVSPDDIRDPKDRIVLGCALGGNADYIVSGDKDLLVLTVYQDIPILKASEFLQKLTTP